VRESERADATRYTVAAVTSSSENSIRGAQGVGIEVRVPNANSLANESIDFGRFPYRENASG
jgi:hypothetical protein